MSTISKYGHSCMPEATKKTRSTYAKLIST